jgi:hypothetical protein
MHLFDVAARVLSMADFRQSEIQATEQRKPNTLPSLLKLSDLKLSV